MAKDNTGPLSIANEMRQFDRKNRDFYDSLTEEEKKKFSPYLMIRWGSSVNGSEDLQTYYLLSTNRRLNHRFFSVNTAQHKKLQWLMATTVSPDMGTHRHNWIPPGRRGPNTALEKRIATLFPHMKPQDVEVMARINSEQDIKDYEDQLGER